MNQGTRRFLAEQLSQARLRPPLVPVVDWRRGVLASYGGAIAALVAAGELTEDEAADWRQRMDEALGLEPSDLPPPGPHEARFRYLGEGEPPRPPDPFPPARFLGLHPVSQPDRPLPYGGRVQILGVERYDSRVAVSWRLAPLPDPVEEHRLAIAAHDRDTEGLPEEERTILRDLLVHRLVSRGATEVGLADDVGTAYRGMGGGSSGGGDEKVGRTNFVPAVPDTASVLTVTWEQEEFVVPLS